jgi:hypothetical protein
MLVLNVKPVKKHRPFCVPAFAGRQAHNDGELGAWLFLYKLIEHCATQTAAKNRKGILLRIIFSLNISIYSTSIRHMHQLHVLFHCSTFKAGFDNSFACWI